MSGGRTVSVERASNARPSGPRAAISRAAISRAAISRAIVGAGLAFGAGLGFASCVDVSGVTLVKCPPEEDFKKVSPVLEQRCGTLDCHGNPARPLRIYGSIGLRAPDKKEAKNPNYYPGGSEPTTDNEIELNYRAVCGLEPEIIGQVMGGQKKPESLTLVRKPRLDEKHKGGRVWDQGKPGDRCLTDWLQAQYQPGEFDDSPCKIELANQ
jgi:hypothetical protein